MVDLAEIALIESGLLSVISDGIRQNLCAVGRTGNLNLEILGDLSDIHPALR